jgi:hypothetical protein
MITELQIPEILIPIQSNPKQLLQRMTGLLRADACPTIISQAGIA